MPKFKNSNATFWVIFKHCEQVCIAIKPLFVQLTLRADPHESGVIDDWELFYVKRCLRRAKIDFFFIPSLCLFMREMMCLADNFFAGVPIKFDVV